MSANERQVGGGHYGAGIQHWDYVVANDLDYFQGQITKYTTRWKKKGGLADLEKAMHFLEKYIELVKGGAFASSVNKTLDTGEPTRGYVNQDGLTTTATTDTVWPYALGDTQRARANGGY